MKRGMDKNVVKKVKRDAGRIKRKIKKVAEKRGYVENFGEKELTKFREKYYDYQFYEEFEKIYDELDEFIMEEL